jgi:hypothetical protein
MKVIKLFAGLGNQLFQWAYGEYLRSAGEKVRYLLASSPGSIADVFDMEGSSIVEHRASSRALLAKAWAKYALGSYEVGFYQEARYAESLGESRPLRFRRANEYAASSWFEEARSNRSVSIHVRGGDYLESHLSGIFGSICAKDYYERAYRSILETEKDPLLLVFTNDEADARRRLELVPCELRFVDEAEHRDDPGFHLFLMSRCRHHIIANSTYSWWGAFLASPEGGKTVAPDRWKSDDSIDLDVLLPRDWSRVGAGRGTE